MSYLECKNLKKSYKNFTLDVSFTVEEGEIVSLLGPSGGGKSTLLSLLTGLEDCDNGTIILDGKDITNTETRKRDIGLIFQDFSLFQNMNIEENISYGMKGKKKKDEVKSLLSIVGLDGYEKRRVSTLSGGEVQRVALLRAIAAKPKLLLLDEALSSLDTILRKKIRDEIKEINKKTGLTMLFVTHDREEAFALSDRIIILKDGKLDSIGTPEELYKKPKTLFSALFTGDGSALSLKILTDGKEDGYFFFRPENVLMMERGVDEELYKDYLVLNNVKVKNYEYSLSHYTIFCTYFDQDIVFYSNIVPKEEYVTLLILKDLINIL